MAHYTDTDSCYSKVETFEDFEELISLMAEEQYELRRKRKSYMLLCKLERKIPFVFKTFHLVRRKIAAYAIYDEAATNAAISELLIAQHQSMVDAKEVMPSEE